MPSLHRSPYAATVGVNFSAVLAHVSPGTHRYVIKASDLVGNWSQYVGTFDVPPPFVAAAILTELSRG
ncbi:MAG: hypothetical protein WCB27_02785 [Thermoguttaceae bacterium]